MNGQGTLTTSEAKYLGTVFSRRGWGGSGGVGGCGWVWGAGANYLQAVHDTCNTFLALSVVIKVGVNLQRWARSQTFALVRC